MTEIVNNGKTGGHIMGTVKIPSAGALAKIYGDTKEAESRFTSLAENFEERYHHKDAEFFTAPGRTEIIGNHVDHNGGQIIAASIDLDTIGAAYPNGTNVIHMVSEGYRQEVVVDLDRLSTENYTKGTDALVAGIMEYMNKKGYKTGGFDAYVSTKVIAAAGVSSSASFEMLVCAITNHFFNEDRIEYGDYARAGQYAENVYWKKASGLMDQMACAVGGPILLDFSDKENISCEKIAFSFEEMGCRLVIVNTGKGHADLSAEYSSIPMEMREAAKAMGVELLCESNMENLLAHVKDIPNDRAVLRAMHFYEENRRVADAVRAVENKDGEKFLSLLEESGNSSWEWLQNCYSLQNCQEQKITLSLALTKLFLNKIGAGICRVHGGGFAGVIMCVLPVKDADDYVEYMSQYVGKDNVYPMNIRSTGAVHISK